MRWCETRPLMGLILVACGGDAARSDTAPPPFEAVSLLGDTLRAPPLSDAVRGDRVIQLDSARARYDADTLDLAALIWLGRRTAYVSRYQDAIDIYTRGLARHPDDPRLLRHRGHRYISVRRFDDAIADLTRAAKLVARLPDEIEPDGLPNARNEPRSTLHTNVWYHLGLAHYLKGEFERAFDAYRSGLAASTNDDMWVATANWAYMTLRRLGRDADAGALLAPVRADMDVIENTGYYRLLLLYTGKLPVDSLLDSSGGPLSLEDVTTAYGVGNWHLVSGRPDEARRIFETIVRAGDYWAAFGSIAAEAELARP
ncbi:MAG TPA: tetratricopeptide repeat protein [Gemmatimonadales bacterium]